MAWVNEAEALEYTGETLTPTDLATASGVITTYAGRMEDEPADAITARDRRWLAMATAYQAAWMKAKPGVLTHREGHTDATADGVRTARESDSQVMLAPMAARCLRNLSWIGTRTTFSPPNLKGRARSFVNEAGDSGHQWDPVDI